jgi:5-methylcytosine-specific restriction endonuclease McrA
MKHRDKILELRDQGKSYKQIQEILGCSKGTIAYHLGDGQKSKHNIRQQNNRSKQHPYKSKLDSFSTILVRFQPTQSTSKWRKLITLKIESFTRDSRMYQKPSFTVDDIVKKSGENPKCYITGVEIDIYDTSSYHFDHIIPRSKGGTNDIDNLGICTKEANQCKHNLTPDELVEFCKKVLKNKGFTIT